MKTGDLEIWNRFREGDDFSLSLIYSKYAESLYRYGLKFTGNRDLIEDAIHDLFVGLIKNRQTIGETTNIQFYLLKSFRRKLLRQMKGEKKYSEDQPTEVNFEVHYSIEAELISEETKDNHQLHLQDAIQKLSKRQKEAIYLKFQKELDYSEISEILGMRVEACRNLIYRAVKSLRNQLNDGRDSTILLFILNNPAFF